MHKRLLAGLVRDLVNRIEHLLNHPSPVHPMQYASALVRAQACLSNTLKQLNEIYTNHILLPEARFWSNEKLINEESRNHATAAITLWILVHASSQRKHLGNTSAQVSMHPQIQPVSIVGSCANE